MPTSPSRRSDGTAGNAKLRAQDFDEQSAELGGSRVCGQRFISDGRDAAIDGVLIADVVAPEQADEVRSGRSSSVASVR